MTYDLPDEMNTNFYSQKADLSGSDWIALRMTAEKTAADQYRVRTERWTNDMVETIGQDIEGLSGKDAFESLLAWEDDKFNSKGHMYRAMSDNHYSDHAPLFGVTMRSWTRVESRGGPSPS
jgi:hypothetical protein